MRLFYIFAALLLVSACSTPSVTNTRDISSEAQIQVTKYTVEEITFKSDDLILYGTLTTPISSSENKFPAVLLIPGSGPTDQDGNQPNSKTDFLKQIAVHLASQGFASFRFDKRAIKRYQGLWPKDLEKTKEFFSWAHHIQDVEQAFAAMKKHPKVDPNHASILGHSEGGSFAIDVASSLKPDCIVLLAAPGRPLNELLTEQIAGLLVKQQVTPEQKKFYMSELSRIMGVIKKTGTIPADVPPGLQALFPPYTSQFFQSSFKFSPTKKIALYKGPVLVMNGQDDLQVSPKLDAEKLYKALTKRKGSVQQLTILPGLGHGFNSTVETVSDALLTSVSTWLKKP
jgi:dipeptidyl aminopeptidase/acylaminoacyl peptidase